MPTKDEHLDQAEHNRKFWEEYDFDSTPFLDWVVTGIFYEGIHWVEAFLATVEYHPDNHGQRSHAMQRHKAKVGAVATDLEILKQESENARYRCYRHTADDVRQDLVPIADTIKNHVQSII